MKKIFAIISVLLFMTILVQSVPVYVLAEIIASDEAELIVDTPAEETQTKDTESIPYILGEITSERTLDTKVFRMSDGSYTAAVYPVQVHYEENGEMKEIDYRFEEITVDGESLWVSMPTLTRTALLTRARQALHILTIPTADFRA